MSSKREVWEKAKEAGLDGFINAVAKAFPGAIDGVSVSSPKIGICSTDANFATVPQGAVKPGARMDKAQVKAAMKPDGLGRFGHAKATKSKTR